MVKGMKRHEFKTLKTRAISTISTREKILMCFKGIEKEELSRILPKEVKCPSCNRLLMFRYNGEAWEFYCVSFLCKKYNNPFSFKSYLRFLKSQKPRKVKRRWRTPVSITGYDFPLDMLDTK